jgi:hypothetical protein
MPYTTTTDNSRTFETATIEQALTKAETIIYVGHKDKRQAREALTQGQPAHLSYGFKTVTITPTK